MSPLSGFRKRSFVEQISALDAVEREGRADAIPELLELYREPLGDDAVDGSVADTLRALLRRSEEETVKGLRSSDLRTRALCATTAGLAHFASAGAGLVVLARDPANDSILVEILAALSQFGLPESLEVFRAHLRHPDPVVSALCVEAVGVLGDERSLDFLCRVVDAAEEDGRYEHCELVTDKAIRALARLGSQRAASFLLAKIHHRNPTARKLIDQALVDLGSPVIPLLAEVFRRDSVDDRILAANILGAMGDRKGGDVLVSALDRGAADHPNIRFAIYEALGAIDSLTGLVCLLDGLSEENETVLMAAVTSLDRKVNPGVISRVRSAIQSEDGKNGRVLRAIVASRAAAIFEQLCADPALAAKLIAQAEASNDPDTVAAFAERLRSSSIPGAKDGAERLSRFCGRKAERRLLAVDDSRSMLLFYQSVGAELGLEVATAVNGRDALELLGRGETFDLIITDLNMPVMDGIELTRQVRSNALLEAIPVLMATTESEGSQVALAEKAGVTGFLRKPLTPPALRERVQALLG